MKESFNILILSLIASVLASTPQCSGQSWTTDTYNTYKMDYHFDSIGKPVGYDRFIFENLYGVSEAVEECGYVYRYSLKCGEKVGNTYNCTSTCYQFLFRFTDAKKENYLKDCGSAFHNKFADTKGRKCIYGGKDLFEDYKKIVGTSSSFIVTMDGTKPELEQDFHYDKVCIFKDGVPVLLEGAIVAFLLIAACMVTIFAGLLISSIKQLKTKNTGLTTQLVADPPAV